MHARIDQLLSLRDGEPVEAEVRVHVQHARSAWLRLRGLRRRVRVCRNCRVRSAGRRRGKRSRHRLRHRRATTVAWIRAAAAVAVVDRRCARGREDASHVRRCEQIRRAIVGRSAHRTYPTSTCKSSLRNRVSWIELLQYLPERPQVERVSLAATVDSIEERIQVLDWQLAYGSDAGLDRRQAQRLWSERVELMDSLVKVRYAESAPMAF